MKSKFLFWLLITTLLITAPPTEAQQAGKIPRIGLLLPWSPDSEVSLSFLKAFREGLQELGYVENRDLVIEQRYGEGVIERLPDVAAELVRLQVNLIVTSAGPPALAAKQATKTIPIVFIFVPDPVGSKFVISLARPGGNATGLTHFAADLIGKRLEFLKETIPRLARTALLVNPDTQVARLYADVTNTMAAKLGLSNQVFTARSREEMEPAFDAMVKAGMQAVTINSEGVAYQQREYIANLAIARRLPLSVWSRETLEAGALMSYGADQPAMCRRAAVFVHKILKGAKPGDLPVEEPQKIEFVLNKKTAKALGLTFPNTLLVMASDVVE